MDGPTKEEFVWGFRTGMLTFEHAGLLQQRRPLPGPGEEGRRRHPQRHLELLAPQPVGPGQGARPATASSPSGRRRRRFSRSGPSASARSSRKPEYAKYWEPYPFNAGYFMCLKLKGLDAETYRKHLLEKYGVGVIADGERDIRVAFSAVDVGRAGDLYALMAAAARDLLENNGAEGGG